jgi:hypothetical protein
MSGATIIIINYFYLKELYIYIYIYNKKNKLFKLKDS